MVLTLGGRGGMSLKRMWEDMGKKTQGTADIDP